MKEEISSLLLNVGEMRGSAPDMRGQFDLAKEAESFDRGERIIGHEGISANVNALV